MTMLTCATGSHHPQPVAGVGCARTLLFILTLLAGPAPFALAQEAAPAPMAAPSAAKPARVATPPTSLNNLITATNPAWKDLTPAQQLSLKPLAEHWGTLEEAHKRKWIAIAASYPTLAPPEQIKLHSRMTEWASLSKQQRAQARLNFTQSKQLSPSQKTATWEAYQALSPEEKQKLATLAPKNPAGAATASKHPPPEKLAVVPANRKTPAEMTQIAPVKHNHVDRKTLLPHSPPPLAPASAPKN